MHACRVYLHDPYADNGKQPRPPKPGWSEHHRYATEEWLLAALRSHPWRVSSIAGADVAYVATDFARLCSASRPSGVRSLWQATLRDPKLWPANNSSSPRGASPPPNAFSLQLQSCPPYGMLRGVPNVPPDVLWLSDFAPAGVPASRYAVTPFVISQPAWLAGAPGAVVPAELRTAWRTRRLLLFAGHVPRLSLKRWGQIGTRFDIWRQVRYRCEA